MALNNRDGMKTNYVNFLAGNPLNRLSWKRSDSSLMNSLASAETSKWIVFSHGQPLVWQTPEGRIRRLALLNITDLRHILGEGDLFHAPPKAVHPGGNESPLESARIAGHRIVFLGVYINKAILQEELQTRLKSVDSNELGTAHFAVDIASSALGDALQGKQDDGASLNFVEPRSATLSFAPADVSLFAEARSMTDWNSRNKFCPACGSTTYSSWAGWKISCSSLLDPSPRNEPCPSSKGLQNYVHPRTDPVIIVAVINGENKILLGRNKSFPKDMYSCIAGFIEPGESIEEAVKREVQEEAGIPVNAVQYHSAQPWPYPANLMIGCFARTSATTPCNLDGELEDVQFFTQAAITATLAHPHGAVIRRANEPPEPHDDADTGSSTTGVAEPKSKSLLAVTPYPKIRVPPVSAIAGVLISEWAYDRVQSVQSNL